MLDASPCAGRAGGQVRAYVHVCLSDRQGKDKRENQSKQFFQTGAPPPPPSPF